LKLLVIRPDFPKNISEYESHYIKWVEEQVHKSLTSALKALKLPPQNIPLTIEVESDDPATQVIRHVLREENDFVIKEAEPNEGEIGFKAMDMELLRKCPCPLWLHRSVKEGFENFRVAVAVNPEDVEEVGHNLSLRLLELSHALANKYNGELHIISCWDYEFEEYLRYNSQVQMQSYEIINAIKEAQIKHKTALKELISDSHIGDKAQISHMRGEPDKMIPKYIEDSKIDIIVMGTVARTGITGFFIGNTAENILQKLRCSLLAVKPVGFVSPVKAY